MISNDLTWYDIHWIFFFFGSIRFSRCAIDFFLLLAWVLCLNWPYSSLLSLVRSSLSRTVDSILVLLWFRWISPNKHVYASHRVVNRSSGVLWDFISLYGDLFFFESIEKWVSFLDENELLTLICKLHKNTNSDPLRLPNFTIVYLLSFRMSSIGFFSNKTSEKWLNAIAIVQRLRVRGVSVGDRKERFHSSARTHTILRTDSVGVTLFRCHLTRWFVSRCENER